MVRRVLIGTITWKRLVFSLIEIYLALTIFVWFFADRFIHHGPRGPRTPLEGEVQLQTSDGIKLSAVWLPNPAARHILLFSHGNAENLAHDLPYLKDMVAAGFSVLAYDYRGYGRSEGKPTEKGLYRDIEAAYDHLTKALEVPPERILPLGRSLGSGPAVYLASTRPVGGLILESPFTSAFRVVIPFPFFPFDQFPNLRRLRSMRCPLLVIHGTGDEIISFRHGRKIFEVYRGPKTFVPMEGARHNDLYATHDGEYVTALQKFSREMGNAESPPAL